MRFAIVESGAVANIVESKKPLGENWIQSDTASRGDRYDGAVFTTPLKDRNIIAEIRGLENSVTSRMIRESILGSSKVNPKTSKTARQEIQDIEDQIDVLRELTI
jgi:hypothetical protein